MADFINEHDLSYVPYTAMHTYTFPWRAIEDVRTQAHTKNAFVNNSIAFTTTSAYIDIKSGVFKVNIS